jgi:RHS repeat-associated protein
LGNVLTVISDLKIPVSSNGTTTTSYRVGMRNISDYSPFGVLLPERTSSTAFYRRGFQGQEHDDEVKGDGNSVNFKYRMHDPRVGRFFAVDPLAPEYPHNSPYAFSENRVLDAVEMEGLELVLVHGTWASRSDRKDGMLKKADYRGGSTWKKELGEGLANATGWSKNQTFEYSWSGTNKAYNRKHAAKILVSKLMNENTNPDAAKKHVTLVGHSHGGNINKVVQRILSKKGWTVDIINMETPQRQDFQTYYDAKENGVYLNFYYSNDLIQFEGVGDYGHDPNNVGNYGERKDGNADKNISLDNVYRNSESGEWWSDYAGHSIHKNKDVINYILKIVGENFRTKTDEKDKK